MAARQKMPVYTMTPNINRIVEAILFIVYEAQRRRISITQYDIVKSIFIADQCHLNRYGRPITFDNYVAMQHGPVPKMVYNFLKESKVATNKHPILWSRRLDTRDPKGKRYLYDDPVRKPDDTVLSLSDFKELEAALTMVTTLGFSKVRKLTHEDPAYIDAWEDDGEQQQYPMSYALMFDSPNEERAKELSWMSEHM